MPSALRKLQETSDVKQAAVKLTARDAERAYVELKTDITSIQRFFR
jgi:hypothetical protein